MAKNKANSKPTVAKQEKSINIKNFIGFQLAKILKLKRHFIDLEMKRLGLSRTQWQVLLWMRILGPCSQKELLKNLDIDAAHLARVLEGFEKNKYIVRAPVKGDRRSLFIQMTDYCKQQLIPYMERTLEKEDTILFDGIKTDDKKYLKKLLQKIEENIESALKLKL